MGKIIAVVNQKGGVGKTTTTMNLGYALAEKGKRVLLIDFDPQASLTVCMGYDDPDNLSCTIATLMSLAMEDRELPDNQDQYIYRKLLDAKKVQVKRAISIDLIPSSMELSAVDVSLVNAVCRESVLKSVLEKINGKRDKMDANPCSGATGYDYILIDCSPSLGMLTINALVAANAVIIPVTPEYLSAKGLEILLRNILRVKRKINEELEIEGILFTMYRERVRLTRTIEEIISDTYGEEIPIYTSRIPSSVKVGESTLQSQPVLTYDSLNKVSLAYQALAEEVLQSE